MAWDLETYPIMVAIYNFMGKRRREKIKDCLKEFKYGR